jgi:glycine oxidase
VAVSQSILIAGAGAVGSTCAYVLAKAGYVVTVVDPAPLGDNASGVAAGMLAPAFESLFDEASHGRYALFARARDMWPALARQIGLRLDRYGAMALGTPAEAKRWVRELLAIGAGANTASRSTRRWAAFTPDDWRLDPKAALTALRAAAERRGARFVAGRVTAFAAGQADVEGADTINTDRLVIATGAGQDLARLAPELLGLTPIKGHILRAEGVFGDGPVLRVAGAYLCPSDASAIFGATMEVGRADLEVDVKVASQLMDAGAQLTAMFGPSLWRPSVGVRAATPDGLPLVGRSATPDVVLAVGARRNGWLLAPMIANAVLDALRGREGAQTGLFDPARFSRG